MAFDAGFLACVANELRETALGARIEKVYQPEKDAIVLQMRTFAGGKKLLVNAGSANPRIGFTTHTFENPPTPPQFCLLLRKHLSSAKLVDIRQEGFERVLCLEWEARNEMGDLCRRKLYAEIMGKYSNLIFTDGEGKVLAVLRPVDFTTSTKRQVLPGMRYELPPPQNKQDPLTADFSTFFALFEKGKDMPIDKFITASFLGISASVAREIAYRTTKESNSLLIDTTAESLFRVFDGIFADVKKGRFSPCIVSDETKKPVEYAFLPLTHYGAYRDEASPSALLDEWFDTRDKEARVRQRAADLLRLLYNAKTRILHKLELQRAELAQCEHGEEYRQTADLIVANCYRLTKGMTKVTLTDYNDCRDDGTFGEVEIELDARLSPTDNAARLYKKYNKSKTARVELTKQIAIGESELAYLESVETALKTAETPSDLAEIREELSKQGFASRVRAVASAGKKGGAPAVAEYRTSNGYRVLCGKNNLQNEYITHKVATRSDFWFHAKNMPGSHVVLLLEGKEEPPAEDFTEAASIAALYSAAEGAPMTEVDYTTVRNLKKTPGARPGFVIYHQNWSATVTPDREAIARLRVK